ncbi:TRAP transporter substrate-binding protein DctP [Georgenia sp. AZ-5]|uniref:TRAP transporter substrate-binding protein DctP n=1 Tax=Georgenia sp. AZ-5 TaxID=3367526 RepID=UPI003754D222
MLNKKMVRRPRAMVAISVLAVAGMTLSACGSSSDANDSGSGDGGGDAVSVDAGASQEEYAEALTDVDPVELSFQMATAPGVATTAPAEKWAAAVEEWSDGKVQIEVLYSGARVPVHEMSQALQDGLVDGGFFLPYTAPEMFPVNTWNGSLLSLHDGSPFVGTMQMFAEWVDFGANRPELVDEVRANNIEPLLMWLPGNGNALFCTEPVTSPEDAAGMTIRTNTPITTGLVKELGAATADVPTAEVYSALQRGVVDCAASALSVADSMSIQEVSKHWTLDNEVQAPPSQGSIAFNKDTWEGLPLAVRQLLWDRLDVYLEASILDREFEVISHSLQVGLDAGVTIHDWDEPTREKMAAYLDGILEDAAANAPANVDGEEYVSAAIENHEKWAGIIEDLGYTDESTWAEFPEWYAANKDQIDVTPLIDKLVEEVLTPNRPTA